MKVTAYFAASLDGFIAKPDGSIDWLNAAGSAVPEGEDCGFGAFLASVDALVMGRNTFEQVLTFGMWPYGDLPVIVLSSRPLVLAHDTPGVVSHSSETPEALCARIAAEGMKRIYVDGGKTVQGFLAAGLLDEVILSAIPVILGGGLSPYGTFEKEITLRHVETKVFDFGFLQSTYEVRKD